MNHTPQQHIQTRDAVRFIHLRGTVYPAVDYGCRGPWMYAAVDSVGFRRRTEQTELILAPVLNANICYRDRAISEHCREWCFNNIQLQSAVSQFCGHYCVCFCILRHVFDLGLLTLSAIQALTILWCMVCCVK